MSNTLYLKNKNVYDKLQKFLEEKLSDAQDTDDIKGANEIQEQLDGLQLWMKSSVDEPCNIPEITWKLAKLEQPELDKKVFQDLSKETDTDIVQKLFSRIREALNRDEIDKSLLDDHEQLKSLVSDKEDDEKEEFREEVARLTEQIVEKRKKHTRALLKQISETENLGEKGKLISEAERWNPEDYKLLEEIKHVRKELDHGLSIEEIRQHLTFLQSKEHDDINQFATSLRILEGRQSQRPDFFTNDELKKINDAREKYNKKRLDGGKLTSMVATGQLLDAYIAYREIQGSEDLQVIYKDKVVNKYDAEAEIRNLYLLRSKQYLQDMIGKVDGMKVKSPSFAVDYIDGLLNARIEREINGKLELINEVPLESSDKTQLVEYKTAILKNEVPRELESKNFIEEAKNAKNLYDRVSLLIKSYSSFPTSLVEEDIKLLIQSAIEERIKTIRFLFEQIENDIGQIKNLQTRLAITGIEKIHDRLDSFDAMISEDWLGITGYDTVIAQPPINTLELPPRPSELNDYTLQNNGKYRKELSQELRTIENNIDQIATLSNEIEALLSKPSTENIHEAIKRFGDTRDNLDLVTYRSYKDLEKVINKHEGLVTKIRKLQQLTEMRQYEDLLEYYYANIDNTDEFLACTKEDRKTISGLVTNAEYQLHNLKFKLYFHNKNYRAAHDEMNWLNYNQRTNGEVHNENEFSELEAIVKGSKEIERFYEETFNIAGINSGHPLLTVFSRQKAWISGLADESLSSENRKFVEKNLDATKIHFSKEKIYNSFAEAVKSVNFQTIQLLTKRILHIANELPDMNSDWPESPTYSTVLYDANHFVNIAKDLIKERIINELSASQLSRKRLIECLEGYVFFDLARDGEFEQQVCDLSFRHALLVSQEIYNKPNSKEENFVHWEFIKKTFPNNNDVDSQYLKVKKQLHEERIQKYLRKKKWEEANEEIKKTRMDTLDYNLLLLEFDFLTNFENTIYFSSSRSADVLENIRKFNRSEDELNQLEAKQLVAEIIAQKEMNLLRTIEALNDEGFKDKDNINIVTQKNNLIMFLQDQILDSIEQSSQNIPQITENIIKLYYLSEIGNRQLPERVKQLLENKNFKNSLSIFVKNKAKEGSELLDPQGGKLIEHVQMIENLIPILGGIINFLHKAYQSQDINVWLNELLGLPENNQDRIRLSAIETILFKLRERLSILNNVNDRMLGLKNKGIWLNFIKETLVGSTYDEANADIIELRSNAITDIEPDPTVFQDVAVVINSIKNWIDNVPLIADDFINLRKRNEDDFTACMGDINNIQIRLRELPILFDQEFTEWLKVQIDDNIKFSVSTVKNNPAAVGLSQLTDFLNKRDDQIKKEKGWQDLLNEYITEYDDLISKLKSKKDQWWQLLEQQEKTEKNENYSTRVDKLNCIIRNSTPIPENNQNIPRGDDNQIVRTRGLWDLIRRLFRRPQENLRHDSINKISRDFDGVTLQEQLEIIIELIALITKANETDHHLEHLSEMSLILTRNNNMLLNNLNVNFDNLNESKELAQIILNNENIKILSKKEINKFFQDGQYGNVQNYYIAVSPYKVFPQEQRNLRNILLRRLNQGVQVRKGKR